MLASLTWKVNFDYKVEINASILFFKKNYFFFIRMPNKKLKKCSSSSSSDESDDERLRQLKEATVSYEQITNSNNNLKQDIKTKSKRHIEKEEIEDNDINSFNLTPEFQDFVSKKLRSKLDEFVFITIFYLKI